VDQKKKRTRRMHTREFKADTVALVRSGRGVPQVAQDLRLANSLVYDWCRTGRRGRGQGSPGALTTAEKKNFASVVREVKVLRMEREILKRAATFFAKESA